MRTIKAIMVAGIATFLAAGLVKAGADAGQSGAQATRTSVRSQTAAGPMAQANDVFDVVKVSKKTCTYRGGPKNGSWDCR